jgi:tape measure domain-containing protein
MARIKREAARTPFELPGLTQAVQLLASVTHDGDKAVDVIMNVGEGLAAMGKGQAELDRVIVNLQQIASLGHAATIDIKQFAFAGIPIYEMLTEQTGLAGEALSQFITDGGVTFDLLTTMFDRANDEGGRFFNAFQNQSGTFNQALSNMKDSIGIFLADIMTSTGIFHGLTVAMLEASTWLQNYKQHLTEMRDTIAQFLTSLDAQTGIITAFKDAWQAISDAWTTSLGPALAQLWTALDPFKPLIVELARLIGGVLVLALIETIKQLARFIEFSAQLLAVLMQASAWIISTLSPTIHAIGETIEWVVSKVEALISALTRLSGVKSTALSGLGNGIKVGLNGLTPFASGGIVTGPTPALVGEAGPEAIIPLSRMGSLGGITVNNYGDVFGIENFVELVGEALMNKLGANARVAL